jgi:hypothetical protein
MSIEKINPGESTSVIVSRGIGQKESVYLQGYFTDS